MKTISLFLILIISILVIAATVPVMACCDAYVYLPFVAGGAATPAATPIIITPQANADANTNGCRHADSDGDDCHCDGDPAMTEKRNASRGYVPAIAPKPPRPAPTVENVSAKWRDNLGMWIGVFVVLMALRLLQQMAWHRLDWASTPWPGLESLLIWTAFSFCVGAVAFGLLMVWRSALDERERQGEYNALAEDNAELSADLDDANVKIGELEMKLANAMQDLRERMILLQRAEMRAGARVFTPAIETADNPVDAGNYKKARQLIELACRNQPFSKDKVCTMLDWTQGEWRAAHQLAQDAGIFRVVGNRTEVLVSELAVALAMIDIYAGFSVSQARLTEPVSCTELTD